MVPNASSLIAVQQRVVADLLRVLMAGLIVFRCDFELFEKNVSAVAAAVLLLLLYCTAILLCCCSQGHPISLSGLLTIPRLSSVRCLSTLAALLSQ